MSVINQSIISNVIKSFDKGAKQVQALRVSQDKAIQVAIDAFTIACDKPKAEFLKGNAKTNDARGQVKAMFDALVEAGHIQKSAGANYQTSFWIAFTEAVPFQRDLFKSHKPASEPKAAKPKAGKIESTDRKALDATLSKAIKQARLLGLTEFAADIVDLCIESLDDFKEAE
jgi:hypothetical protein